MKTLHVKNTRPHEKIFVPVTNVVTKSLVFSTEYVDQAQAAVVGAKIENEYLVYIGNVNPGEETENIILGVFRVAFFRSGFQAFRVSGFARDHRKPN
jgi:hypothetical protein